MHNELTDENGYVVIDNIIPHIILDSFISKLDTLHPTRASSSNKIYAEKEDIKNLPDISVWWSQLIDDFVEAENIKTILEPIVKKYLPNIEHYASDTVFIEPNSKWVNPHVDSPHRFEQYNKDKRLLGIQCIVPLYDLDKDNGATGVVPNSQTKDFPIDLCYKGYYNGYFNRNYIQPTVKKGSILLYNCRLLHSSMPNPTDKKRPAMLFNYLDNDIIPELKAIDNIWNSNEQST